VTDTITPDAIAQDRNATEVHALVADRYLDALLAAGDRGAGDVPADADLDPAVRDAARLLHRSLVRVHPSFRFEERLAGRLAAFAAAQTQRSAADVAGNAVLSFPAGMAHAATRGAVSGAADRMPEPDPRLAAILAGHLDPTDQAALDRAEQAPVDRRPLLVGGALTSAAISIVGVAWVAWRASRPSARSRALAGAGIGGPA
jgi:hypothetical protein